MSSSNNNPEASSTTSENTAAQECPTFQMTQKLSMGAGKPFPLPLTDPESYIVDFDGENDPKHPYNWKLSVKLYISVMVCLGTLVVTFNSAVFAPGITSASNSFGVSSEVGTLGTTLYVLGFASSPTMWAPVSELQGRKWPLTVGMIGGGIFTVASAVAKDIQTLLICRFFGGMFGASQLSVVPAVLADIFNNTHRGVAMSLYALTVFIGPLCAPLVGGFITSSYLGWRWTLYIPAFLSFVFGVLFLVFLKETYAPALLVAKAAVIRRHTNNWAVHAKHEEAKADVSALVNTYFSRPLRMLLTEPIILFVSVYMSFIYGLVYAFLEVYPYVFENMYNMSPGVSGLTFMSLVVGVLLACGFIFSQQRVYARKLAENKNVDIAEWRLFPSIVGAPVFTIGLFWFSWTGFTPAIPWIVPAAAGVFIGFGVLCIFLPCFNYIVDAYLPLAASAVAANIILRSAVAAGFPLFAKQMFQNLGVQWAGTLLGCLAAVMIPIPFTLRVYGPRLRQKSYDKMSH